jgi:hypothetical protein
VSQVIKFDNQIQTGKRTDTRTIQPVHIVSCGSSGTLQLGEHLINTNNLPSDRNQLRKWRKALANEADSLLYGCGIDKDDAGRMFYSSLVN